VILMNYRGVSSHDGLQFDSLTDPATLRDHDDVRVSQDTMEHEDADHHWQDVAGQVAVGVTDADGRTLLMVNEAIGVVALPHGDVEPGEDWLSAARREIEAVTGVSIALEDVVLLREIDHVVAGESDPHTSTFGLLFRGAPTDGEIQGCKESAEAGSDGWYAEWFETVPGDLPDGVSIPEGGPGEDLELIVDSNGET
jgi:ADP-ribose pyrophosphatase YjhB (NUDIX family)